MTEGMAAEHRHSLGWLVSLWLAAFVVFIAAEIFHVLNRLDGPGPAFPETWFLLISSLGVSTIAVLVLSRLPHHRIGWLLYAIGLLLSGSYLLDEYSVYAEITQAGSWPLGREASSIEVIGATAFGLVVAYLFLYFPDGQLPSPRWRPVATAGTIGIVGITVSNFLRPGPRGAPFDWDNPLGIEALDDVLAAVSGLALALLVVCGLASLSSLVTRFRRADGTERRQLEWVFLGGAFFATVMIVDLPLQLAGVLGESSESVFFAVGFTAIPVTMGIAILRYRLYDIDTIINRTLVYVPLTAFLAGLYVAMTGLLRTSLTEVTHQGSDAAIALSTLTIAALLTPMKNWLQAFVDKRFKETPQANLRIDQLTKQAESVVQVLQREAFLREYLREIVAYLGATGGAIHHDDGVIVEGQMPAQGSTALRASSHPGVTLSLGPRQIGREYGRQELARLQSYADVVGALLTFVPSEHPPRRVVNRDDEPAIEALNSADEPERQEALQ